MARHYQNAGAPGPSARVWYYVDARGDLRVLRLPAPAERRKVEAALIRDTGTLPPHLFGVHP